MNNGRTLAILGVLFGFALGVVGYSIPQEAGGLSQNVGSQRMLFLICSLFFILSLEAVFFFWSSLKSLKPELRRAFQIICVGVLLFGLAQAQVPLTAVPGMEWWTTSGIILLPYLLSTFFMFWGVRNFALLVGLHKATTKFSVVIPMTLALIVAGIFLPVTLSDVTPTEVSFHAYRSLSLWQIVLGGVAAYNAWLIRKAISPVYRDAMTWLGAALATCAITNIHFIAIQQIGYDNWYASNSLELLPLVLMGLLLVRAGYAFWKISGLVPKAVANANPLDVVTYLASLVSKPAEVDITLDTVRQITATMNPGSSLSDSQQEELADVYAQLRSYLLTKEPLRSFTEESLRADIQQRFTPDSDHQAFWNKIKAQP